MTDVPWQDLANHTQSLLDRVEGGESMKVTVDGRQVAILGPVTSRARFMPREIFIREILAHQADPGLRDDLRNLVGD